MSRHTPTRLRLPLAADPGSDHTARHFVAEVLRGWGVAGDAEDVLLVVSELVTNAVRHTREESTLYLTLGRGVIWIEVEDHSQILPQPRTGGSTGGWGLGLVQRLTSAWGALPQPGGKTVWCEMRLPVDSGP
jgi:anti-sigma regulatory factor (Ser/Thr protein kinase)